MVTVRVVLGESRQVIKIKKDVSSAFVPSGWRLTGWCHCQHGGAAVLLHHSQKLRPFCFASSS